MYDILLIIPRFSGVLTTTTVWLILRNPSPFKQAWCAGKRPNLLLIIVTLNLLLAIATTQ